MKKILNILNGQAMYNYFKKYNSFAENGVYVPFNEAMCVGKVTTEIFSNQFNKCRSNSLCVTIEQYIEITIEPLRILFENQFSHIVLWFDEDMFCQINLLTILAYLDQINYSDIITFNLVDHKFKVVNTYKINVPGYFELYKKVMIDKCLPLNMELPVMENGIKLYFEYLQEKNEVTKFISLNANLHDDILVSKLLNAFPQYGLGDIQYLQLIENYRSKNIDINI